VALNGGWRVMGAGSAGNSRLLGGFAAVERTAGLIGQYQVSVRGRWPEREIHRNDPKSVKSAKKADESCS
jgi:hypothetical protein